MDYDRFDVVILPFPFTDKALSKRRPVLVLSTKEFNKKTQHIVTAMITTAKKSKWVLDTTLVDSQEAGLPQQCIVRMKFFTADCKIVLRKLGRLSSVDKNSVSKSLRHLFDV